MLIRVPFIKASFVCKILQLNLSLQTYVFSGLARIHKEATRARDLTRNAPASRQEGDRFESRLNTAS